MKLDILFETPTLEGMQKRLNIHFDQVIKVCREEFSLFESYRVYFTEKFIPEMWKYHVVCNGGVYHFGKLKE